MTEDAVKAAILALAQELWRSDKLRFTDTARSQALREDILTRLLALAMTDDERAAMLGLPEGCRVRESAKIIAPASLVCGEFVWIGENSLLDASGGLSIGAHSTIAVGAQVWSHSSVMSNLMLANTSGNPWITRKSTVIGAGCYIGGPSSIYPGVSIGDGSVVLPMSTVTENVPPNSMVGGSPARVIRQLNEAWRQRFRAEHGLPEGR